MSTKVITTKANPRRCQDCGHTHRQHNKTERKNGVKRCSVFTCMCERFKPQKGTQTTIVTTYATVNPAPSKRKKIRV